MLTLYLRSSEALFLSTRAVGVVQVVDADVAADLSRPFFLLALVAHLLKFCHQPNRVKFRRRATQSKKNVLQRHICQRFARQTSFPATTLEIEISFDPVFFGFFVPHHLENVKYESAPDYPRNLPPEHDIFLQLHTGFI